MGGLGLRDELGPAQSSRELENIETDLIGGGGGDEAKRMHIWKRSRDEAGVTYGPEQTGGMKKQNLKGIEKRGPAGRGAPQRCRDGHTQSTVFTYTSNECVNAKIESTIPFIITPKK